MNQLATIQNQTQWTPEQLKLIVDTVARGASNDELKLFLYRCQHMGLDPLKPGMVHFIKYGTSPGTIVVGIEGFRSIAARTGKVSGIERGVHRDNEGRVVAGWCKVYRSDWNHPAHEEVPFEEYTTGKGPWSKMPATMIKKVAEAAALRMAFPDDLGGVYERSEMDQAEGDRGRVGPEQPTSGDGVIPDDHDRIKFGQWKPRTYDEALRVFGPEKVASYIAFLEDPKQVAKRKPENVVLVEEFIERMSEKLAMFEREQAAVFEGKS